MRKYLSRKIHVSWLVAWFSLAFIVGIAAAYWAGKQIGFVWIAAALTLALFALLKRQFSSIICIVLAGLIIGLLRGGIERSGYHDYEHFYGKTVNVTGIVSDDSDMGPNGDQRLKLKNCKMEGFALPGQIWISTYSKLQIKRSDVVTLHGKLKKGFGSYPASMNFADIIGAARHDSDVGLKVRDKFADSVKKVIPEPQSSLAVGFLVGQHSNLPNDLEKQLKIVGLTHIIVASGYNLTILVVFARRLLLRFSKFMATFFASTMIFGFIAITGLSPSMTRAGLVSALSLAAWYYGRKIHPLVLLPFAAAITVAYNPGYVWGDIGWYLSFASFAGVLIFAPLAHRFIWKDKKPGVIREIFIATFCAQLATLPIIIFTFGHYSVYALISNLLVLPLIPIVMVLTFCAGITGLFLPGLATLFGFPAAIILRYMTSVISFIANLPGAQGTVSINVMTVSMAYSLLIACAYLLWRKTHYNFRTENIAE